MSPGGLGVVSQHAGFEPQLSQKRPRLNLSSSVSSLVVPQLVRWHPSSPGAYSDLKSCKFPDTWDPRFGTSNPKSQ